MQINTKVKTPVSTGTIIKTFSAAEYTKIVKDELTKSNLSDQIEDYQQPVYRVLLDFPVKKTTLESLEFYYNDKNKAKKIYDNLPYDSLADFNEDELCPL